MALSPPRHVEFETIYEDPFLAIRTNTEEAAEGDAVLLSFTGIGHAMGAINVQRPEFVATGIRMGRVIFISDLTRSWGNALDFTRIHEVIAPLIEGHRVLSIGNSMGGFLSVIASNFLPIDTSLSFAAQFTVSPALMPEERRYWKYSSLIEDFRFESLNGHFNDRTRYLMFFGDAGIEKRHWDRIDPHPALTRVVLKDQGHAVADRLKACGMLDPVINACFEGRFSPDWLHSLAPGITVTGTDPIIVDLEALLPPEP